MGGVKVGGGEELSEGFGLFLFGERDVGVISEGSNRYEVMGLEMLTSPYEASYTKQNLDASALPCT